MQLVAAMAVPSVENPEGHSTQAAPEDEYLPRAQSWHCWSVSFAKRPATSMSHVRSKAELRGFAGPGQWRNSAGTRWAPTGAVRACRVVIVRHLASLTVEAVSHVVVVALILGHVIVVFPSGTASTGGAANFLLVLAWSHTRHGRVVREEIFAAHVNWAESKGVRPAGQMAHTELEVDPRVLKL